MGIVLDDIQIAKIKLTKIAKEEASMAESDIETGILASVMDTEDEAATELMRVKLERRAKIKSYLEEEAARLTTQVLSLSGKVLKSQDGAVPILDEV